MTKDEAKQRGYQFEEEIRQLLQGDLTPGSGAGNQKGDVKSTCFHVEAKFKSHADEHGPYLDLDLQWLEAIWRHTQNAAQSRGVDRIPTLALQWVDHTVIFLIPLPWYQTLDQEPDYREPLHFGGRKAKLRPSDVTTGKIVQFDAIEVPELLWVCIERADLFQLRKEIQPPKTTPKKRWANRGFRR